MTSDQSKEARGLQSPALQQALFGAGALIGAVVLGWQIGTHEIEGDLRLFLEVGYFLGVLPGLIFSVVRLRADSRKPAE